MPSNFSLPDKQKIIAGFNRSAKSYDSADHFQRRVSQRLLHEANAPCEENLLVLGCGTGNEIAALIAKFKPRELCALDISEEMLKQARSKQLECSQTALSFIQGDIEALPFQEKQFSIIFSSLAIQWCSDLASVFTRAIDLLKPGGSAYFSTLTDGSLIELKRAWAAVDDRAHVNAFLPLSQLQEKINNALIPHNAAVKLEVTKEHIQLEYAELRTLLKELKHLGANTLAARAQHGLGGKKRIERLTSAYEAERLPSGMLPASYQVAYIRLHKEKP